MRLVLNTFVAGRIFFVALMGVSGCATSPARLSSPVHASDDWRHLERQTGSLQVTLPDTQVAEIGFELTKPRRETDSSTWIVLVPGSGAPSRKGEQNGDGLRAYAADVEVYAHWARALATAGFPVFAFDKRNCHPRHHSLCRANPTHDVDREGPDALFRDVDAACAWIRAENGDRTKLVLMSHGQGLSPILRSDCVKKASGLVALSPIPRRIDHVLVHAMEHRQKNAQQEFQATQDPPKKERLQATATSLRNQAATLRETFDAMERDHFAPDARIRGATLAYWRAWIHQTAHTRDQVKSLKIPTLMLLGKDDQQFGPEDQTLIRRFSRLPATLVQEIPGADHHLLDREKLSQRAANAVIRWLRQNHENPDA